MYSNQKKRPKVFRSGHQRRYAAGDRGPGPVFPILEKYPGGAVKNADLKEKIAQNCVLGFDFNAKTIVRCNALVIVSVVTKVSGYEPDGSYSTTQEDRWEMFDAGIANQTFCLAAHSKGVGSVILGVFDENKIRQYLTLPDNERVTNLIALGYPLEGAKNAPPRKEVSQLLEIVE